MAHFGTLRDYRFDVDEVDDIRGATLFSPTGEKIAKIHDVVFDHSNGQIRYLVADSARKDHYVLVPLDRVWHNIADEENFETDLNRADLDRLPHFDEKALENEQKWQAHLQEHEKHLRKRSKQEQEDYNRRWHDGVVQHRHGSTHNITPDPDEMPAAPADSGSSQISAADLTPQRISDKFQSTPPMFTPTMPGRTTIRPAGIIAHVEDAREGGSLTPLFRDEDLSRRLPPRFSRFEDALHSRIVEVRGRCTICGCQTGERVA